MTHRNHHEREFEAFLAGEESELARLYRRLPQSEPDAKLDAAVLGMARTAVEPQRMNALRHAKDRHRRPLWLVGLSSAAGVVLAAGLAWQMRGAFNESLPSTASSTPAAARAEREVIPISAIVPPPEPPAAETTAAPVPPPPPALAAPAPAAPPAPLTDTAKAAPRPAKAASGKVEGAAAGADKKDAMPRSEPEVPAEPRPQPSAQEALSAAAVSPQAGAAEADATAAADRLGLTRGGTGARAQPFPGSAAPDYNSVERKAAIASGTRRDDYGLDADAGSTDPLVKQEERARAARQSAAPTKETARARNDPAHRPAKPAVAAEIAPSPPAPAAAPAVQATATAPAVADTAAAGSAAAPSPPAAAAAPEPEAAPAPKAAAAPATAGPAAGSELQRNAQLAPDEWVKKIRELLRAGRKADAIENRDLLRRRHPDYVLPEDLRTLRP